MENETISGDIFIVPNSLPAIGEYPEQTEDLLAIYDGNTIIRGENVMPKHGELFVQVWVTGSGSSDWSDHYAPGFPRNERVCFPDYLPVASLEGLREGDSFEMTFLGKNYRLTCRQQKYRYWEHGPFQTILKKLVEKYYKTHQKAA